MIPEELQHQIGSICSHRTRQFDFDLEYLKKANKLSVLNLGLLSSCFHHPDKKELGTKVLCLMQDIFCFFKNAVFFQHCDQLLHILQQMLDFFSALEEDILDCISELFLHLICLCSFLYSQVASHWCYR